MRLTDSKSAANDLREATFLSASGSYEAQPASGQPAVVGCICGLGSAEPPPARRAHRGRVGAEDAALAGSWTQHRVAAGALEEVHAGVPRHHLPALPLTYGAPQRRILCHESPSDGHLPNAKQISSKRPERNCGPLLPLGASLAAALRPHRVCRLHLRVRRLGGRSARLGRMDPATSRRSPEALRT